MNSKQAVRQEMDKKPERFYTYDEVDRALRVRPHSQDLDRDYDERETWY